MKNLIPLASAFALVACASKSTQHRAAPGALGPYSASVSTCDLAFFAGRIGATRGSFQEEVETAIGALEVELKHENLTLADLVQVTVYLTDMSKYEEFNAIYARKVPEPFPARSCVGASALPQGAHVLLQGIASRR